MVKLIAGGSEGNLNRFSVGSLPYGMSLNLGALIEVLGNRKSDSGLYGVHILLLVGTDSLLKHIESMRALVL